jgi:hypothetical protein
MSLPDWERNGWLTKHQTSRNEIRDLLQVVERDLADSAAEGLSADWRMNIAYNAGLQAATVALAAAGYRAARDAHHYRVIQSLHALTITPSIEVTIGRKTRLYHAFITTAPTTFDAPATLTLHTAPLSDVSGIRHASSTPKSDHRHSAGRCR